MTDPSLWAKLLHFTYDRPVKFGLLIPAALGVLDYCIRLIPARFASLGYIPLGFGLFMYVWAAAAFFRAGGTGRPKDAPKLLIVKGPYALCRNPMYVGVIAMALGLGIRFSSAAVAIYVCCLARRFHQAVVVTDEPRLAKAYGQNFLDYACRIPRWLPLPLFGSKRDLLKGYNVAPFGWRVRSEQSDQ